MQYSKKVILSVGFISSLAVINNQKVFNIFGQREKQSLKTDVFIWGNGDYQARPDVGIQFKNFEPKQIEQLDNKPAEKYNFQQINFGEFHEAGIDEKGGLYVWKKKKLPSYKDPNNNDNSRENLMYLEKSGFVQVGFTKGFVWGLNNKGEVYQWQIQKEFDDYNEVTNTTLVQKSRQIKTLPKNIKQIATGEDHFIALTTNGEVYTMGDDTYGQCGIGSEQRSTSPPFYDRRVRNPEKVENLPTITKIVTGHNHSLALSDQGILYGWGSNEQVQLSHEEEFSKVDTPLIAIYQPVRLMRGLGDNVVTDMAAGENTTFIVTRNKSNDECEVFSCGHNINGQLGLGYLRHVSDIAKMEGLSNYKISTGKNNQQENVTVKKISCGSQHCMALLSIGAIMEWGQNEHGQLGNKKRTFTENPIILGKFKNHNVLDISCGWTQSAVITERKEQKQDKNTQQSK